MGQTETGKTVDKAVDKPVQNIVEITNTPQVEKPKDPQRIRRRRIRALRSFLFRLIALALVIYILMFHIVGLTTMPNGDMFPRVDAGDMLLFYRIEKVPKAQDIVVIKRRENGEKFVLRVIAGPGDKVEVTEEKGIAVNGNTLIESDIFYTTRPYEEGAEYPILLNDDEYFVMADMRNGGMDSRYFGPVKQEEIQGVVITIFRRNRL